jgi:hypothetical protein
MKLLPILAKRAGTAVLVTLNLAASLVSTSQALAGPLLRDNAPVYIMGTGGFSCGRFMQYQRMLPNNEAQMELLVQWVWGFLAAYNERGRFDAGGQVVSQLIPPDSATVLLFLNRHCMQHPQSTVAEGTLALLKSLGPKGGDWTNP